MKRSYTNYVSLVKKACKREGCTKDDFLDAIDRASKHGTPTERQSADDFGRIYEIEEKINTDEAVHLFLPNREFCDWLVGCVKESDPAHAYFLQQMVGVNNVGVFHFPCDAKLESFGFYMPNHDCRVDDTGLGGCFRVVPKGRWLFVTGSSTQKDFECFSCEIGTEGVLTIAISHYIVKLIVGLGMYSACFPEVVKDGPPVDLKHPSLHQYDFQKLIGVAPEVFSAGGTHASPEAHFRKGHLRVLRSEKFTHKRFQVVFVRDTFVKGKAMTVLSPEEAMA